MVAFRSLGVDPFDRMLLTADGTVTKLLEACAGETIVTRTTQLTGPATLDRLVAVADGWWRQSDARLLELAPDERLIARRVVLRGTRSASAYVLAESVVALDRLPGPISVRLVRSGASLGRLLAAGAMETRREVLQITTVRAGTASDDLTVEPGATLARRTYRIVSGHRAAAVVTEWLAPGRLAAAALATLNSPDSGGRP